MPNLDAKLLLERCPHCCVAKPNLGQVWRQPTTDYAQRNPRTWAAYLCDNCGGVTLAYANKGQGFTSGIYPTPRDVEDTIPSPARDYLFQAINSLHAPAGAVMLAASSVDAMLKAKGYTDGNLYPRINKAAEDHLITDEVAKWAHEVRLDANDQRHADVGAALPDEGDAQKCIDFAQALGMFLFVLPARVSRGREQAGDSQPEN